MRKHGKPDVIIASSVHPLTMVAVSDCQSSACRAFVGSGIYGRRLFCLFGKTKETSLLGRMLVKGEHWIYKNADAIIFTKRAT